MSIVLLTYVQDRKTKFNKILLPQPSCILPFVDRMKKIKNVIKNNLH